VKAEAQHTSIIICIYILNQRLQRLHAPVSMGEPYIIAKAAPVLYTIEAVGAFFVE
jgi:hypothetical protein